jgi:hypothetical protein
MFAMPTLETISDRAGRVVVGWVDHEVLYARFEGGMSADLGTSFASHVALLVAKASGVRYFADASRLTHYDLLARSAFIRMALRCRDRFASFTILTWPTGVGPQEEAVISTLGGAVSFLTDTRSFDVLLSRAAPLAKERIGGKAQSRAVTPPRAR